jgi:hypothetical protein
MKIAIVVGTAGRSCLQLLRCCLVDWPPRCSLWQNLPARATIPPRLREAVGSTARRPAGYNGILFSVVTSFTLEIALQLNIAGKPGTLTGR